MKITTIESISKPSLEQFARYYEERCKPVVIKGLLADWPAAKKWNTDYFKEKIGDVIVPVRVKPADAPPGYFAGKPNEKLPMKQMRVRDYVELFEAGQSTDVYMSGVSIPDYFPNIEADIPLLPYMNPMRKTKKQFWLGIKGTVAPLHLDIWDNFACQISGLKRFVLFDPRDVAYVYPYSMFSNAPHLSQMNLDKIDTQQYPLSETIVGYEAVVQAGDVLYMPAGWWHQVWTDADSILVNFWWFRMRTAFAPWFFRYYPFLLRHYRRHQKAQGRIRAPAPEVA